MTNDQQRESHTSAILRAFAHEFAVTARSEGRDGKLRKSKEIAKLNGEYLAWLQEQRQK